jgi:hypothetical protein
LAAEFAGSFTPRITGHSERQSQKIRTTSPASSAAMPTPESLLGAAMFCTIVEAFSVVNSRPGT